MATEIRGARDLSELWRALPAGVLRYRTVAAPDLPALSDTLRARAWREHCAAPGSAACADRRRDCPLAGTGRCRADALFPMHLGGGAPQWRMATLFLQWWPGCEALHLIALGETAAAELGWAARCLHERHGLEDWEPLAVASFGDLELRDFERFRLRFVTPWVVEKGRQPVEREPDRGAVARELAKAMRARACKLTALCANEESWQRLGGHLAHHVADHLFPSCFAVEATAVQAVPAALEQSTANRQRYEEYSWNGEVIVRVEPPALPWLSLLALCGGGENADKGKGRVELLPLANTGLNEDREAL